MAIDRPEPYNTLYPSGFATERNQRTEITRLTEILAKLEVINTSSSSSSESETKIAFESELTRRLIEDLLVLVSSKLDINLVAIVKAITGTSEYSITDIITTLESLSVSITGTVDVNVLSSVLPSNAAQETGGNLDDIAAATLALTTVDYATEAKQDVGNTSLASIAAEDFATETTLETLATEETLENLYSEDINIRRLAEQSLLQDNAVAVNNIIAAERGGSTRFVEIR